MDFNTGTSGSGGQPPPRPGATAASSGPSREFDLSDPVGSFIGCVRGIVLDPVGFFRGMQKSGNFVNPLLFYAICAAVGGILAGVLLFFFSLVLGDFIGAFLQLVLQPLFYVFGGVIGLFIWAGITHLLAMLFVTSNAGFEATYRVWAYLGAFYLVFWLAVIPLLGWLLAIPLTIWYFVLGVLGVREAHSTTTGRAAAVVLIPVGVIVVLTLIVVIIAAIIGATMLQSM